MSETNGRMRANWGLLLEMAVLLVAVVLAYGALSTRISVLEDRYERVQADLIEIKSDVKRLLARP